MSLGIWLSKLGRKKYISDEQSTSTKLDRCLSTVDLTLLGIGSTLGLGIYVLAGQVAKESAGPAVTLSFFIAAVASVFAGLCYAEFGARVPKAGSAYIYSYVTVGEFLAFVIGWNLILEYVIGTASVARGYSGYLDAILDHKIRNYFNETMPIHVPHFADYPDFLAFGITFLLSVILAVGVKESSMFNNVFTGLNLLIVLYVIICGLFKADLHNWQIKESEIPKNVKKGGKGGFFPFGISGMLEGAATCFYGFVGFDCIATTGEEVKNPKKAIPISIIVSLLFIFLAYFGIASVITLMIPYYMQDSDAPLPYAFEKVGWSVAKWIISIGALAGLSTSLLGAMFPLPRVIYAMANDGLIFRFLANIHPRFKTPVLASIISGTLAGLMAAMFNLDELVAMMSIGTLLAYTLVAISVLILRYSSDCDLRTITSYTPLLQDADNNQYKEENEISDDSAKSDNVSNESIAFLEPITFHTLMKQYVNPRGLQRATKLTESVVKANVAVLVVATLMFAGSVVYIDYHPIQDNMWIIGPAVLSFLFLVAVVFSVARQPQNSKEISFKVPAVPYIPCLSIFVNLFLMLKLNQDTWIRFAVWMAIGLAIYILYGYWESSERYRQKGQIPPNEDENTGSFSCLHGCICTRRSRVGNQEAVDNTHKGSTVF